MADFTAAAVKDLRERTGAGMMDCKKALAETGGDIEAAIDWLRARASPPPPRSPGARRPRASSALPSKASAARSSRSIPRPTSSPRTSSSRTSCERSRTSRFSMAPMSRRSAPHNIQKAARSEKLTDNIAKIGENQSLRRAGC